MIRLGRNKTISVLFNNMNHFLLLNALLLFAISCATIYSAGMHKPDNYFLKELIFGGVGIIVYFVLSFVDYRKYDKYYIFIYIFNILLLGAVFVIGDTRLGAQRWIPVGPISIQPSEFAKIFLILSFSQFLVTRYKNGITKLTDLIVTGIFVLPVVFLIITQPDLGTTGVIIVIYATLIFLQGVSWRLIGWSTFMGIMAAPVLYFFGLKDYQRRRILSFLSPEANIKTGGWHVHQSLIAIGSGGLTGKGFMQNTQSTLKFLPESHTDFIGAVFLEEWGFRGGVILILLYLWLLLQILHIGRTTSDRFGKLVCYGVAIVFFSHIFVNLGIVMGMMPVTGIPLLFMSYGGSSIVFCFMMLGIVQSIKVYRYE